MQTTGPETSTGLSVEVTYRYSIGHIATSTAPQQVLCQLELTGNVTGSMSFLLSQSVESKAANMFVSLPSCQAVQAELSVSLPCVLCVHNKQAAKACLWSFQAMSAAGMLALFFTFA